MVLCVQGEEMTTYQRIKQEYKEPFRETIKAFAIQGHRRRAVAKILDADHMTILRLIKRYNCDQYFKPTNEMRRECRSLGMTGRKA
jgi:transposase